jgi:undecaprenyl-diphosphatase
MTFDILKAIILGIVEGLTEFVPVSSTGHLLLVQRFFGFADEDFGKTFAVLIQFGAILALLSIYFVRLWKLALGFFTDPAARRFVIGILLAFPAGGGGRRHRARLHQERAVQRMADLLHADRRRRGAVVDRHARSQAALSRRAEIHTADVFHDRPRAVHLHGAGRVALGARPFVGAMLLGADRRSAAEFSFWLAMPTDGRRVRLRSLQVPRPDELRATPC